MSQPFVVRDLETQAEYAACVALQRETWGSDFQDVVPPSILQVSQKLSGVAAGAFDANDAMLGFVYGMTGIENGAIVHWSDMLAVRSGARDAGIGRALKEYQREAMKRLGAAVIYWTFDPLVARNAHLNFNVFGVTVERYVRDMYGTNTGSSLHQGLGTDRLVVAWPVPDSALRERRAAIAKCTSDAAAGFTETVGEPESRAGEIAGDIVRLAVPLDIHDLLKTDARSASAWRASNRAAFERLLETGYEVDGFRIDRDANRGFYLMRRSQEP